MTDQTLSFLSALTLLALAGAVLVLRAAARGKAAEDQVLDRIVAERFYAWRELVCVDGEPHARLVAALDRLEQAGLVERSGLSGSGHALFRLTEQGWNARKTRWRSSSGGSPAFTRRSG